AASLVVLSGCEKMFDSLSQNKNVQSLLELAENGSRRAQRLLTRRNKLAKEFEAKDISPKFRANGNPPPITMDYTTDAQNHWTRWRLEVSGLVKQPASFSLADLQAMPSRTQITRHDCVEGWSVIGKWKGVRLEEIINRVQPATDARYVVFRCMDTDSDGLNYFESIDMIDAVHPQTILAYELNDRPLPIDNGAPLRLRVENQLGYKHAKYIRALEFVSSLDKVGQGKGGYWEDQGYEWYAGI
ncbi:MAG TPA: molybdopterin-binding protein, partial [Candidatus Eisenbacteria bacterium]|nr:molybdopterin-binding protein [Candidatus Eisenbacteria bacterium]